MEHLKQLIRTIPDFPKRGIEFRDLTTLFLDPKGFAEVIQRLADHYKKESIDIVVGIESRGFVLGAPLAIALGKGFVPVRKPGKLPGPKVGVEYSLEYGTDRLEIHTDAITKGMKVLVVDDLLATGGTMEAATKLVEMVGGKVVSCAFVVELPALQGRKRIAKYPIHCMIEFEGD
jgi:adenine phosphoribosyltransferase